jgi:hypothetical protein
VAKVTGPDVIWGPEVSEGHDDSLAVDLAVSKSHAVLVWDDVRGTSDDVRKSNVMLASFDVPTMRSLTPARPVSGPKSDAGSPRVVQRPGGYWLAYLARGQDESKKKPPASGEDEQDDTPQGEAILPGWVEVVPLDENGIPTAAPRPVTPKKGYAVSFDLQLAEAGGALVLVRDDDTPLGASGGKLSVVLVSQGGISDARIVSEESESTGIPTLLRGFLAVATGTGATQIAALGPRGELLDPLAKEPSLGTGQPIASTNDRILWARPQGKGMAFSVLRCAKRGAGALDAGP